MSNAVSEYRSEQQQCMTLLSRSETLCTNMLETDIYVVASMRKTFMDSAIMELVSIWP